MPPVRLQAGDPRTHALAAGKATLMIGGEPVELELVAPAGPVEVEAVLPILQGLSSLFATRAEAKAAGEGRTVSCRAGCGACCRQLVPVAPSEARALARLVEAMPAERRAVVRTRFTAALERLGPLLDRLGDAAESDRRVGLDYFRQGVACPFLEAESCSIHADRPLSCREYLVTSPAGNCQAPGEAVIDRLPLEGDPSVALLGVSEEGGWLPLVQALEFDAAVPAPAPSRTGAEILGEVLGRL